MLDEDLLKRLRAIIHASETASTAITQCTEVYEAGSVEDHALGSELITRGEVACLVVAGGQGTRLGFNGPKGMFPVTAVKHKSLFQLLAEKVVAASEQAGRKLYLAIMTSKANDSLTRQFFADHQFFGLAQDQLAFFTQGELPFLDPAGNPILDSEGAVLYGPDGNGGALEALCEAGIAAAWQQQGIRYVNFIQIDNPLADPFDAELVGFHAKMKGDATIKSVPRRSASENVGTIVQTDQGIRVMEYSELPEAQRHGHRCANISCFCFSLPFVQRAHVMELHKAWKRIDHGKEGWKFERFIFDVLPQARNVHVLLYDRKKCFAPLKNASGEDSSETVAAALYEADRRAYENISGLASPPYLFELHPRFHYPTPELTRRWKGRALEGQTYLG